MEAEGRAAPAGPGHALVADRLRRYRNERRWTQADLARKAGLSPDTVSRIERGERPRPRTAQALADAIGVPVERLLGLADQPPLFPTPDERRMAIIRSVIALGDDEVERAAEGI